MPHGLNSSNKKLGFEMSKQISVILENNSYSWLIIASGGEVWIN